MTHTPTSAEAAPLDSVEIAAIVALSALGAIIVRQQRRYGEDLMMRRQHDVVRTAVAAVEPRTVPVTHDDPRVSRTARAAIKAAVAGGWSCRATLVDDMLMRCADDSWTLLDDDVQLACMRDGMHVVIGFTAGSCHHAYMRAPGQWPVKIGYRIALKILGT